MKKLPVQSFARRVGRMMWVAVSILMVSIAVLLAVLFLWSPGTPAPFFDENGKPLAGSISEKIYVNINGVEQGMFIKGKDVANPVLLYLHGGTPDYFLTQNYSTGLEEDFVVVWWEQRGAGLSYSPSIPQDTMTADQLVADTLEVTNYLRRRFGKDKIYLMGHSGGTFTGIEAAAQAPELYYAYIGVAQMSYQLRSEKLAYDYMLAQFKEKGNTSMVRQLEEAPVTMSVPLPRSYQLMRDQAMHSLGIGTTHDMNSVISGLILPSLQFPEYTVDEKIRLWRAKSQAGVSVIWNEMLATDLSKEVPRLEIPVYFLHGIYDYTVSYPEAKSYFEQLIAPVKGFYTFEQSAHSPHFEEPEKTLRILRQDVLTRSSSLADTP